MNDLKKPRGRPSVGVALLKARCSEELHARFHARAGELGDDASEVLRTLVERWLRQTDAIVRAKKLEQEKKERARKERRRAMAARRTS